MDYSIYASVIPPASFNSLVEAMVHFNIDTTARCSHFLAQIAHESNGFSATVENLNYSSEGLLKTFPKYFTPELALKYHRKPQEIASRVYANRMGNGDEASREGYLFRGRGFIQLTGKTNYLLFGTSIGEKLIMNPDVVSTTKYAALSAAWFWSKNKLNSIADKGTGDEVVLEITKKVNGGTHGYADRLRRFKSFLECASNTPLA